MKQNKIFRVLIYVRGFRGGRILELSDEKIINLCLQNDIDGFNSLYSKYEKYIYRLCYYYTNSKEDSLDLLQDIYIKIYKAISTFDNKRPLIPWIKKISINTCQNYIRDNKNNLGNKALSNNIDIINLQSNSDIEDIVEFIDTKKALVDAIRLLPEDIKSVVILRHVENLSYKEISEYMSIPIGTVKTYLFRGRKQIKDYLKKEGIWEV
ncbi:RNA polymerase sigma factor [Serpentinicella alkaliphila]|uniref:RNA polymerase RpoE-like sigma-24 subunit n=1 Tax=Serpentinicella alkaliphila TaxID=1734049 RepID=A0A4R2U2J3_9FIRM|nr:RNA polymerase sigma factor [Serpentinicella alkaliphila]TCQ08025.1 RNA polymerase RpoE-like sigma-24 subunit [Serpentinicella alkaliphila]